MSRTDTNTKAIDEAANDEHANILRGANDNGANTPDDGTNLNGALSPKNIRQLDESQMVTESAEKSTYETRSQSADKGTSRHGGRDTALNIGLGTRTLRRSMRTLIKVAFVLLCANTARNGQ